MKGPKINTIQQFGSFLFWASVLTAQVAADDSPWLGGDWSGIRKDLTAKGIDFEFLLTLEGVQNLHGGIARSSRGLLNLDMIMDIQSRAFGLPDHGLLHTYLLGDYGGKPTEMVGDIQTSSNIEAPDAFKLYEFYWEQGHRNNTLVWLFGLHDYNRKFNVLNTAGLFTNSSFGIEPDISQVGPSIFPTTSLAAVTSLYPCEHSYLHLGVYDGVPGAPDANGTHVILDADDGYFCAAEGGMQDKEFGTKLGLGIWYRSTHFNSDINGNAYSHNAGAYLIGEANLYEHWAGFFQVGYANRHRNPIGYYVGTGVNRRDLLKAGDVAGLGLACAFSSDAYRDNTAGAEDYELAVECTYECQLLDWFTVQPDLQYIKNPGFNPALKDALVASLRAYLKF